MCKIGLFVLAAVLLISAGIADSQYQKSLPCGLTKSEEKQDYKDIIIQKLLDKLHEALKCPKSQSGTTASQSQQISQTQPIPQQQQIIQHRIPQQQIVQPARILQQQLPSQRIVTQQQIIPHQIQQIRGPPRLEQLSQKPDFRSFYGNEGIGLDYEEVPTSCCGEVACPCCQQLQYEDVQCPCCEQQQFHNMGFGSQSQELQPFHLTRHVSPIPTQQTPQIISMRPVFTEIFRTPELLSNFIENPVIEHRMKHTPVQKSLPAQQPQIQQSMRTPVKHATQQEAPQRNSPLMIMPGRSQVPSLMPPKLQGQYFRLSPVPGNIAEDDLLETGFQKSTFMTGNVKNSPFHNIDNGC